MHDFKRTPLTAAQYRDGFAAYLTRANMRNQLGLSWFENRISKEPTRAHDGALSMIDVGAGTGSFTRDACVTIRGVLDRNCRQGVKLLCTTLEPNEHHHAEIRNSLKEGSIPGAEFTHYCRTWEHHHENDRTLRYDIVLARNVLYYSTDWRETIRQLYESLTPDGRGYIYHNTARGFNQVLRWASGWECPQPLNTCLFVEAVCDELKTAGIPYTYDELPDHVDITACFDSANPEGQALLNFITDEDLGTGDSPRRKEAQKILKILAYPEFSTGNWKLCHPVGAITFWRKH